MTSNADDIVKKLVEEADHVPGPTPYGTDLPMLPEHVEQQVKGFTERLQADPEMSKKLLQDHAKLMEDSGVLQSDDEVRRLMVQATVPIMEMVEEIKRNQIRMVHGLTQAHMDTMAKLDRIIEFQTQHHNDATDIPGS